MERNLLRDGRGVRADTCLSEGSRLPVADVDGFVKEEGRESIGERLGRTPSHQVLKITCIDWREGGRGAYLLTSAGAAVHQQLIRDLELVLSGKKILLLQGHSDCAKSKAECPRREGETAERYARRVDDWTILRLWRGAGALLEVPAIREAITHRGLELCVAFNDLSRQQVRYFERETEMLVRSKLSRLAA